MRMDGGTRRFDALPARMKQVVEVAASIVRRMASRRLDIHGSDGLISLATMKSEVKHGNGQK